MGGAEDTLLAAFDRLAALDPVARERELAALALDADTERTLRDLLAADGEDDRALRGALEQAARRLQDDATPAATAGARIGPWRVLREIGAGGMGTVFLAERADGAFAQQVAIKLLRGFPTEDGKRRLRREREILAALDHPHIARLLDGGETPDGQPYLVMEYVEGVALADWLAGGAPTREARLALFDALCAAVAHAHRQLVVHRDLKPGNVLVRADGAPKLLDFGVARLADLDGGAESTRVASAGWASPEQRAGGAITTASDVYSLGVLLRVLLGGRNDLDDAQAMPLADAELRGVVAMATADDPRRRYPTAEALLDDVERWRARKPLRAARDTRIYRLRKFVSRNRAAVLGGLAAVVAGVAFVIGLGRALDEARRERSIAESAREEADREREAAQRVGDFMVELFANANPARADGAQVSARDLVAAGSDALLDDRSLTPTMRARLLERLAMVSLNLGDLTLAQQQIARADAERGHLSPPNRAMLDYTYARILARREQLAEAGRRNAQALEAIATLGEMPLHPELRANLMQQAMWLANRAEDWQRTIVLAPRALDAIDGESQRDNALRAYALNTRAVAEGQLGLYVEQANSLAQAHRLIDADPSRTLSDRATIARNHATALRTLGRLDEAGQIQDAIENATRGAFEGELRRRFAYIMTDRLELEVLRGDAPAALRAAAEVARIQADLPASMHDARFPGEYARAQTLAGRHGDAIETLRSHFGPALDAGPAAANPALRADVRAIAALAYCGSGRRAEAVAARASARSLLATAKTSPALRMRIEKTIDQVPHSCRDVDTTASRAP